MLGFCDNEFYFLFLLFVQRFKVTKNVYFRKPIYVFRKTNTSTKIMSYNKGYNTSIRIKSKFWWIILAFARSRAVNNQSFISWIASSFLWLQTVIVVWFYYSGCLNRIITTHFSFYRRNWHKYLKSHYKEYQPYQNKFSV